MGGVVRITHDVPPDDGMVCSGGSNADSSLFSITKESMVHIAQQHPVALAEVLDDIEARAGQDTWIGPVHLWHRPIGCRNRWMQFVFSERDIFFPLRCRQ
jgi:hypothetical protein